MQTLSLHRDDVTRLMAEGVLDSLTLYSMRDVRAQRASTTAAVLSGVEESSRASSAGEAKDTSVSADRG